MVDEVTIAICNFNTTELTNNCIKSVIAKVKSFPFKIIVLDNSDVEKFKLDPSVNMSVVTVLDNTAGKYIDFNKFVLQTFTTRSHNNHGSAKHCFSVQYLINICTTKHMILLDSDTIVKRDLNIVDESIITCADTQQRSLDFRRTPYACRFTPFV